MWSAYSQIILVVMVGDAPSHCHWVCGYDFKAKSTVMSSQLTNQQLMKPTPHSHSSPLCFHQSIFSWLVKKFRAVANCEVHCSVHMLLELGVSSSRLVVH